MKKLKPIWILTLYFLVLSNNSWGHSPSIKKYKKGLWETNLSFDYFKTDSNYVGSGSEFDKLPSGNFYTVTNFTPQLRWVLLNNLALTTGFNVGATESRSTSFTRTNSAISDYYFGSDFLLWKGYFDLITDYNFNYPAQRISTTTDSTLISEGDMSHYLRFIFQKNISNSKAFIHLGYKYRDEGRSALLPWGVGAEFPLSDASNLGLELSGYTSIGYDQYTNDKTKRTSVTDRVNGRSYKFYSINPSLMEANFWFKHYLDPQFYFRIGGGSTITGSNSANGYNFFVMIGYSFEKDFLKSSPKNLNDDEALQNFTEETNDGVNQNIFIKRNPVAPKPDLEAQKEVQKNLDNTEMQIELKTKPKKKKKK